LQILTFRDIKTRLLIGETCLRQMVKDGDFPKPIRITKQKIGWRETDVLAWVEARGEA
jgi:prophage regulatory protein